MIKITTLAFSLTKPSKNKNAIQVSVYKSTHPQQREKNQKKKEKKLALSHWMKN